jgi:pimeloyl-ACP methyl ester carboxylesterase
MSKNYRLSRYFFSALFSLSLVFGQSVWAQDEKKDEKKEVKKEEKEAKKEEKKEEKKDDKTVVKNTAKGRLPVILIPGLIGSELINKSNNDKVWFDLNRAKDDDLRLPISPNLKANRDNLVPVDIVREIQLIKFTPKVEVYQKLIETLQTDGFTEGKIDFPEAGGDADTFYVFPYDWRLDNVENAQILLQKLDNLRAKLNHPDLKFNVIAHSMGGLITRYAAMYGKADLTTRAMRPTWKGASYFNSISLVATPNEGATGALDSMINGFSLFGSGKLNLPFVQNLSRADLFTIQSIYQLLPHAGTARVYDENLKPMKIDLYNPATWEKYGWTVYTDEDFTKKFDAGEQLQAKAYFRAVLLRAKQFQAALDAATPAKNSIPTYYLGAECRQTIDGMIIRRDSKKDVWKTEFGAVSFTNSRGVKVTKEETEKVLLSPGDGVVPKRSLLGSLLKIGKLQNLNSNVILNSAPDSCAEHNRLTGDATVTKNILSVLNGNGIQENTAAKVVK